MSDSEPFVYRITLDHGVCEITIPATVTRADVNDLVALWGLIAGQASRRAQAAEIPNDEPGPST